jgi:hypothetical protein
MRRTAAALIALSLTACSRADEAGMSADTAATAVPLSAFAGRWTMRAFSEAGDSIVGYQLTATADTSGWTVTLPGRDPVPARVGRAGNLVTLDAGPYESILRPGVQVRTQGTVRLEGDSLVGTTIARYSPAGADSVLRIRVVGRRTP